MSDLKRLEAIRETVKKNEAERNRLSGIVEASKLQLAALEEESMSKFGVPVAELETLAHSIKAEKEEALRSLEKALGL